MYEEAAHVTKRIRVLHPKTSPAGYCAPLGASIRMVCKFLLEGAKRQRTRLCTRLRTQSHADLRPDIVPDIVPDSSRYRTLRGVETRPLTELDH